MIKDVIGNENRTLAVKECLNAKSYAEEEERLLNKISGVISTGSASGEPLAKMFRDVIIAHENAARKIAGAQCLICKNDSIGVDEDERLARLSENSGITITQADGKFIIKAPMTFLKTVDKNHARLTGRAVYSALIRYIESNNIKTPVFDKADVAIVHHIKKDIAVMNVPDADNIDTKSLLDAVDGLLFPNDDLLTVRLVEYGVVDDNDFTEVVVQKRNLSFL